MCRNWCRLTPQLETPLVVLMTEPSPIQKRALQLVKAYSLCVTLRILILSFFINGEASNALLNFGLKFLFDDFMNSVGSEGLYSNLGNTTISNSPAFDFISRRLLKQNMENRLIVHNFDAQPIRTTIYGMAATITSCLCNISDSNLISVL